MELIGEDFTAEKVEGKVDLAARSLSAGVAMGGEVMAVGFRETGRRRVLNKDAQEGGFGGGTAMVPLPPADVDKAEDEKTLQAAFAAVDALVERLRTQIAQADAWPLREMTSWLKEAFPDTTEARRVRRNSSGLKSLLAR
jgi:hypothetical protein